VATADALVALGVGMGLSVMLYLRRSALSVVRRSYRGDSTHSQTTRPPRDLERLERYGRAIAVMELHGPVFFGSAENLARSAETLIPDSDTLIIDLSRVNDLEHTGVLVLRRLDDRLKRDGKTLLLAGLWRGRGLRALMHDMNFDAPEREGRLFDDIASALAAAEDRLLARIGTDMTADMEMPLSDHPHLHGLTQAQFDLLSLMTRRLTFAAGDIVLNEGDPGNSQFFLVRGRVRIEKRSSEGTHVIRLASIESGAIFGEMAMLTSAPRSADVVAQTDVVCHELTATDVEILDTLDPAISFILMRNIAIEMSAKIGKMSSFVSSTEA
jgi:CRP-like cAMP-binding protein/ABC-type transporter Mla MlaB component